MRHTTPCPIGGGAATGAAMYSMFGDFEIFKFPADFVSQRCTLGKSRTRRGLRLEFGNLPKKVDVLAKHVRREPSSKGCGGSPIARPRQHAPCGRRGGGAASCKAARGAPGFPNPMFSESWARIWNHNLGRQRTVKRKIRDELPGQSSLLWT
jgi:hypothetical protein